MRNVVLLVLVFLLGNGCIERLDLGAVGQEAVLVVDGMLTDQPGSGIIRLYYSSGFGSSEVTGASVSIIENGITILNLTESQEIGVYYLPSFQGKSGAGYQLKIITQDEKEYVSSIETLHPAGAIDTLYYEFKSDVINLNDPTRNHDAFAVYMDATGDAESGSLLRWRWRAIYHGRTFPELRTKMIVPEGSREPIEVPDPLPCSGFIVTEEGVEQEGPCQCCDCYVDLYSDDILLSENEFAKDNHFKKAQVAYVPIDGSYFYDRYYIEVEQLSLSESVYDFWSLVKHQSESGGDIFQPNVVKVKGNMTCVSDPEERVFGVFAVSSVTKGSVFIYRSDLPYLVSMDTVTSDCRQYFENSTNQRPPFW